MTTTTKAQAQEAPIHSIVDETCRNTISELLSEARYTLEACTY